MSEKNQHTDQNAEASASDCDNGKPDVDSILEEDQVTLQSNENQASDSDESVRTLQQKIDALDAELVDAKEHALRAVAEAQNARRRAEQDIEKAHKFGLEKLVNTLLPVVDNLERALDASKAEGADPAVLNEGVELTLKSFVDALKGHKVEAVDPEGEPFDPQLHQAISAIESATSEPNTVLNVVQKGYTLHGRLVRPAMVIVSKAQAEASTD